jgi:hypothetical protein
MSFADILIANSVGIGIVLVLLFCTILFTTFDD